ncbi:hypothetical protein ACI65C_006273 [Semiaphis heraclei]
MMLIQIQTDSSPIVEHVNTLETESTLEPSKNSISDKVEIYFLQKENEDLKKQTSFLKRHPFGYHSLESDDKMYEFYCGISKAMFDIIVDLCSKVSINYYYGWVVEKFSLKDQILMTFIKLRLNLAYPDLAFRFNTNQLGSLSILKTTSDFKVHIISIADDTFVMYI